ncbi:MAG: tRNA (adenine(22)-N(1))-methyltransferase TrmK, partial [Clostridia bacterium]|nr:tRNA (adenine(22)-N(1))-methyltransferase TrmK [Clostridia bacterium]
MLTKRLEKIVQAIPQCTSLADVGCDHGYIGLSALTLGKADNVVFVDISQPSLHKAKQNCPQNFESKV